MRQWLSNFDSMIVAAKMLGEAEAASMQSFVWEPADFGSAVQFVPLPQAANTKSFLQNWRQVRPRIEECVDKSRYLQFGFSHLIGISADGRGGRHTKAPQIRRDDGQG